MARGAMASARVLVAAVLAAAVHTAYADCPGLPTPTNAIRVSCSTALDGECTFNCETGYRSDGDVTRKCDITGAWTGRELKCVEVDGCDNHNCNLAVSECVDLAPPHEGYLCRCRSGFDGPDQQDGTGEQCIKSEIMAHDGMVDISAGHDVRFLIGGAQGTTLSVSDFDTTLKALSQSLDNVRNTDIANHAQSIKTNQDNIAALQTGLNDKVTSLTTAMQNKDAGLQTSIDTEKTRAMQAETDVEARANAKIGDLTDELSRLNRVLLDTHTSINASQANLSSSLAAYIESQLTEETARAKGEEQRLATLITGLTGQLNTAAAQAQSADTLAKAIVDCNAKGMVYANSKCQPLALQDTTLACSSSTTGVVRYHSTEKAAQVCTAIDKAGKLGWMTIGASLPLGSVRSVPAASCKDIYTDSSGTAPSGTYWISAPNSGGPLELFCNMNEYDGGWTLVYKIADASNMKTQGAFNPQVLAVSEIDKANSAKLHDLDIRALCADQYYVHQWQTVKIFCKFDNINAYNDNVPSGKVCGTTYNKDKAGYGNRPQSWLWGFSGWDAARAVITQLNYGDGRLGSHIALGAGTSDGGCTSSGGCHVEVYCRS